MELVKLNFFNLSHIFKFYLLLIIKVFQSKWYQLSSDKTCFRE